MREVYRILDANLNRASEALRVAEDCGRFALNDPAITAMAKNMRSELGQICRALPEGELITSRDTAGDIGTDLTSATEHVRRDLSDVATAACKRLCESLRTIEEYVKFVLPEQSTRVERMRYDGYTLEQRLTGRLLVGKRFEGVRLYVLVTSTMCRGSAKEICRAAIAGGADAVQIRETSVPDGVLLALAAEMRELTDDTGKLLIVNNRPDIAAIVGADGVHLGQQDIPVAEARRLLRPGAIVGKSSHNIAQALAAVNEGADYVSVGPTFKTATKDAGPIAGVELLREASERISLPLVPIGGISAENVAQLVEAGARRVAVCSAVCCADDPRAAAEGIRRQLSWPSAATS
jgi:thiamine-phosphate pyrophosphorylase